MPLDGPPLTVPRRLIRHMSEFLLQPVLLRGEPEGGDRAPQDFRFDPPTKEGFGGAEDGV